MIKPHIHSHLLSIKTLPPLLVAICFFLLNLPLLNSIPSTIDEAAYLTNAHSISHNLQDEWGNSLPLLLKSFEDYKPAIFSYLLTPFVYQDNLLLLSRLISLSIASTTILALYILLNTKFSSRSSLVGSILLATSPSFTHLSHFYLDPIFGLSFAIFSIALINTKTISKTKLVFSLLFLLLSIYSYNLTRIIAPPIYLICLIYFHNSTLIKHLTSHSKKYTFISLIYYIYILNTNFSARIWQIFSCHPSTYNSTQSMFFNLVSNITHHLSPIFIFFSHPPVHPNLGLSAYGHLIPTAILILILSIITITKSSFKLYSLPLIILILTTIPASYSTEIPHIGRSIFMLIPLIFLLTQTIEIFSTKHHNTTTLLTTTLIFTLSINYLFYLKNYSTHYPTIFQQSKSNIYHNFIQANYDQLKQAKSITLDSRLQDFISYYSYAYSQNPQTARTSIFNSSFTSENAIKITLQTQKTEPCSETIITKNNIIISND